jgi:hypothetical protein
MRAAGLINWDSVRDWLAQAGCAASGHYADYEASRTDRAASRPAYSPSQAPKAMSKTPSIVWVRDGREI